jgi:hypothetical protein
MDFDETEIANKPIDRNRPRQGDSLNSFLLLTSSHNECNDSSKSVQSQS